MMKKLLLIFISLLPFLAKSQGFQVNLFGEKQIGMGHTGTGVAMDGAAVVFNPGAVAMLPENYIQGGISPLVFQSDFNPSGTNTQYHTLDKKAYPFSFYGAFGPKNDIWKIGFGIYTPFGGLADWGQSWQGRYVLESLDLKAIYFQPTLSVKLSENLSIGAGFVYNHGSVDLTKAIPLSNANGQDGQAELTGSGKGYGWNAGIYYKSADFTAGFSHRSQVTTTISGGNAIFTVPASLQANFPQPNTFSATIPLPAVNSIGIGLYPTKKWTLAFDINYVSWSAYKNLEFDYSKTNTVLTNTISPRNYKDAYTFRAGGQYKASTMVDLRFGTGYGTTAVSDGYVTPEAPDANRVYLTGGLGIKFSKNLDLDIAFEYEHLMSRTQTNIESQLSGTFETNVFIPGVSLAYHW